MIDHTLDTANAILYVRPLESLERSDFEQLAEVVDPFIDEAGGLAGLIIDAPEFPGWESFGAVLSHFRFVRDHHKHIKKVGLVTDSAMADIAEQFATHFVSAEVRHFSAGDTEGARDWVMS